MASSVKAYPLCCWSGLFTIRPSTHALGRDVVVYGLLEVLKESIHEPTAVLHPG